MIEHDQAKICIATMGGALAPPIDIKTIFDSNYRLTGLTMKGRLLLCYY